MFKGSMTCGLFLLSLSLKDLAEAAPIAETAIRKATIEDTILR